MIFAVRKEAENLPDGHFSEHVPHWKHFVALEPPLAANSSVNSDEELVIYITKRYDDILIYKSVPPTYKQHQNRKKFFKNHKKCLFIIALFASGYQDMRTIYLLLVCHRFYSNLCLK